MTIHSRARRVRLGLMGLAILALLALLAGPARAQAQGDPAQPTLGKGRDVNDWREYYEEGLRLVAQKKPNSADAYFLWAARLNPQAAEPVHMHWVVLSILHPRLLEIEPGEGSPREEADRARIDSVLAEALRIDPFTPRHYARYVYEARRGYWLRDELTQGYLAYTEANYDRALRLLARVRAGERARPARMLRALSFHAMERFDSAAAELQVLTELAARTNAGRFTPEYESAAVYQYGVGIARIRLGDLEGAREALMRALGEDVSLAAAHAALAQVATARGDTAESLREWALAVELRPASAAMHSGYANALLALGRAEEAVVAYERAIAIAPHWADPYFNEALALDRLRRGPEAAARYAQFLDRAPRAYERQIRIARDRLAKLRGPAAPR